MHQASGELVTRNGEPFPFDSIATALVAQQLSVMPREILDGPGKTRGVCIDDGQRVENPVVQVVPVSGVGAGEDLSLMERILGGVPKLKPHRQCGKAALVHASMHPGEKADAGAIDQFALEQARLVASRIGAAVGRMIGFHDDRATRLDRPANHHLGREAVVGLSGRFPHNLVGSEDSLPPAYRLAGDFLGRGLGREAEEFAAGEALLALTIASGVHGVGLMDRPFQLTALVDADDPQAPAKLRSFHRVTQMLGERVELTRAGGARLNQIAVSVVGFALEDAGDHALVHFGK